MSDLLVGRELDALVAEKVMGVPLPPDSEAPAKYSSYTAHKSGCWHWHYGENRWLAMPYSTDIAAAWEVIDKIKKRKGWFPEVHDNAHQHWCQIWFNDGSPGGHRWLAQEYGLTAAEAICRAALKAVGA